MAAPPTARCLLLSDFNLENLAAQIRSDAGGELDVAVAPFGQVMPLLLDEGHACWSPRPDVALIWTRPEAVIDGFRRILQFESVAIEEILDQVEQHVRALVGLGERVRCLLVPLWLKPTEDRALGILDLRPGGVAWTLQRMNERLVDVLNEAPNAFPLDSSRWVAAAGRDAFSPKFWYLAKIPFGRQLFPEVAADVLAALAALSGRTRKLVILDLDDTLWGGIVGEFGWQGLKLGGHDAIGEAFVDFQHALKALQRRGVVLAIASKNEEQTALEAIDDHPEMLLRRSDFVGWRINWQDKAANIVDLVRSLNLGLDSAVFIDDNPTERARVRQSIPEVLVPEWPADKMLYASTLRGLRCFDALTHSTEDTQRTQMYVADRDRQDLQAQVGSIDEWLSTLQLTVEVRPLCEENLPRASQLLNKTNQMNMSTRRMTLEELRAWAAEGARQVLTLRVSDRFGDSGLTGLLGVEQVDDTVQIVDFVLSCRVFGRKIEHLMASLAVDHARSRGASLVRARFEPTARNAPTLEFWRSSGFSEDEEDGMFTWDAASPYSAPNFISVKIVADS